MSDDLATRILSELGLPSGDRHDHPASHKRFADGAHYRVEIPSVEGPDAMAAVLDEADARGVRVHRVSQGSGVMLQTDQEIRDMAALGAERKCEVCLFIGPRAPWEGSASALVPDGKILGWRHTGMDQLKYALRDVERAVELGVRSVLPADEGLVWLIGRAREMGLLPADLVVKGSALMGLCNPVQVRLMQDAGMNTANIASDVTIAKLGAMRQVLDLPLDLYIEGPDGLGGFCRFHELPQIIAAAAPVILKFGLRNAPNIYPSGEHIKPAAISTGRERVRRAAIGMELLARRAPNFTMSELAAEGLGIPVAP